MEYAEFIKETKGEDLEYTLFLQYILYKQWMNLKKYANSKGIDCEVSLENSMACGIGACLCCVADTDEGHKCVCKEGPVFHAKDLTKWCNA